MALPEFEEMFSATFTNLRMLGLCLTGDSSISLLFIVQMSNLQLMLIEEICFFVSRMRAENFLILTALAPCICNGFICYFKICFLTIYRKKVGNLLERLKALYKDVPMDEDNGKLVEGNVTFVITLCKYFFVLNQVLIWMYNCITLLLMAIDMAKYGKSEYILPYAISVPFEVNTLARWLAVYVHSIIAGFTTQLCLVGVETLYYVLTMNAVIHFTRICHSLECLRPGRLSELQDIVRRHQHLIELTRDLEVMFSPSMLVDYVLGGLQICLLGFNIIAGDTAQMPQFIVFLMSHLLKIFMLCLFGNLLMLESERVGYSAYLCSWYDMNQNNKKILIIIRERASRPQTLTAMRFSTVSYASFAKIISTAWSYFTLLNTFYSPPET